MSWQDPDLLLLKNLQIVLGLELKVEWLKNMKFLEKLETEPTQMSTNVKIG